MIMKFKSIFQKLLLYSVTFNLIGIALLSIIINYSLNELLYKKKVNALFHQADQVASILKDVKDPLHDPLFNEMVAYNKKLSKIKIYLLLLDYKGSAQLVKKQEDKLLKRANINDPNIIKEVLKGKEITHIGKFEKNNDKEVVTVGVPIKNQNKIIGALFLHTPLKEVQTGEVSKIIFIVSITMSIPAILALYWISRKITKPIVQMTHAASSIGKGNFNERIIVESKDEVGQLAQTYNYMADQLENLEKMRKELIRNVSHELRTPLTSVRGFIQGLLEGVIPSHMQKKYLKISFNEIQRLSTLLNSMLDLSAIESGKVILKPVWIKWDTLLQSVVESIQVRMDEKDISFQYLSENTTDLKLLVDPERLKQILFNLLDNAVRHTPNKGCIQVAFIDGVSHIEFSIFNSGKGINPKILPHIWEPFYTEESSRRSHRERSGLGLTISKQLIELMGGTISTESIPGNGTTFTIILPKC